VRPGGSLPRRPLATCVLAALGMTATAAEQASLPILYRKVAVPPEATAPAEGGPRAGRYGGDVRIGDLTGDGRCDFVVYRSADGGMKPCFLAAFDMEGRLLWKAGAGGGQPARPGPVAVHDIDADGCAEVICFFHDPRVACEPASLADAAIQVRDGRTGRILRRAAPKELTDRRGRGPNWVHQRILVANFRGRKRPRDFLVKLGDTLVAFSDELRVLWTYRIRWNEYSRCSAYIPAVGDIDGDGRDEVNGGYYLLDARGRALWARQLGRHMDSVAIEQWDGGRVRAICSGFGHVMAADGQVVLRLGERLVPHGQEVRVARFTAETPGKQMMIRYNGHRPDVMLVGNDGRVLRRFRLNSSPNETGMEAVQWFGRERPALLYNGGVLWRGTGEVFAELGGLPEPRGQAKMGWYHCIPADVCGDRREEVVVYNPWDRYVYVYTPAPLAEKAYRGYRPTARQYNARLMD
jgi:hypothetical protein